TGALVVGDSVRWTLTQNALARLGPTHYAIFTGDRFFQTTLRERMCSGPARRASSSGGQELSKPVCPVTYGLMLLGVAWRQAGSARANQVTIIGVEDPAWPRMAN